MPRYIDKQIRSGGKCLTTVTEAEEDEYNDNIPTYSILDRGHITMSNGSGLLRDTDLPVYWSSGRATGDV